MTTNLLILETKDTYFKIYKDKIITNNGITVFNKRLDFDIENIYVMKKDGTHTYFENGVVFQLAYVINLKVIDIYGAWESFNNLKDWLIKPTHVDMIEIINNKTMSNIENINKKYKMGKHGDLVNNNDFSIIDEQIYYKKTPIYSTSSPDLNQYDFYIYEEHGHYLYFEDGVLFTLIIVDEYKDLYYFGKWNTLDKVQKWISLA